MLDSRPPQQPTPAAAAILLIFIEYLIHWPQNCKIYQLFTSQQHSALLGCCQNQSRPEPGAELEHFFRFHKTRQFGQCPSVAVSGAAAGACVLEVDLIFHVIKG